MIRITTQDDEIIDNYQFTKMVPSIILTSIEHAKTCVILAGNSYSANDDKRKTYINLIFRQSKLAKSITALKFIIQHDILKPKKIYLPHMLKERIDNNFFLGNEIEYFEHSGNFIDMPSTRSLILKTLAHRFYRIIGLMSNRKIIKHDSVVRCYVEVSESIHQNEIGDSLCLFFPFAYKISRQINFYKSCKQRKFTTAFFGVPYSIFSAIKLIYKRSDKAIVDLEYHAYDKHGSELAKFKIKKYFTEDDYVPAAFIVGKKLKKAGCFVVNRSHGIGNAGPYVGASQFDVMTRPQLEFYQYWNRNIEQFNIMLNAFPKKSLNILNPNDDICFIFMHSVFEHHENIVQNKILQKLSEQYKKNKLDIRVKYHPNATDRVNIDVPEIVEIENCSKFKVFLTVWSTSFYKYSSYGLFLFIGDALCNPFDIIDKDVNFFDVDQLEEVLANFQQKTFIAPALEVQNKLLGMS